LPIPSPARWCAGRNGYEHAGAGRKVSLFESLSVVRTLNRLRTLPNRAGYLTYYHEARTHMALGNNAPEPRAVEPPSAGRVRAIPHLGGLHHRYARCA